MNNLKPIDFFIYGAITAISRNCGRPFKLTKEELFVITGMEELQLIVSIKKLISAKKINAIWFDDEVCIHADIVVQAMITGEAA